VIEVADGRVELLVVGERMAASVALERHESRAVAVAVLEASQRILEED
jgi:hypothetical protein